MSASGEDITEPAIDADQIRGIAMALRHCSGMCLLWRSHGVAKAVPWQDQKPTHWRRSEPGTPPRTNEKQMHKSLKEIKVSEHK